MSIWDDMLNGLANNGATFKAGDTWGNKVYNGSSWGDIGNVGDPQQVLQNRQGRSDLADQYLDWNSGYNTNLRSWLQKMFLQASGGADSQFASGVSPNSGIGSRALQIARQKAANQAGDAMMGEFTRGQQLGVQSELAWDADTMNLRSQLNQRQMFNDQQKDAWLKDIVGGAADIGLTALTGGFSKVAGAVGDAAGFVAGEAQGITQDAEGNIRYTGTLNTPENIPNDTPSNWPSTWDSVDIRLDNSPPVAGSSGGVKRKTQTQTTWSDGLKQIPTDTFGANFRSTDTWQRNYDPTQYVRGSSPSARVPIRQTGFDYYNARRKPNDWGALDASIITGVGSVWAGKGLSGWFNPRRKY